MHEKCYAHADLALFDSGKTLLPPTPNTKDIWKSRHTQSHTRLRRPWAGAGRTHRRGATPTQSTALPETSVSPASDLRPPRQGHNTQGQVHKQVQIKGGRGITVAHTMEQDCRNFWNRLGKPIIRKLSYKAESAHAY